MIYGVKGSREIKQTEAGDLLMNNGIDKVIMNRSRVSVERNFRYTDWSGLRSWLRMIWSVKRDWTTGLTILDMVERLEIGL